jgi:uncharacterized membrane protein
MSGLPARPRAPRRATSAVLSLGVAAAAAMFAVAMVLELAGVEPGEGAMTDLGALVEGLLAPAPWAWAAAGAYAVVATPVVGLLATALEYRRAGDRHTVMLAAAVLAVLATSVIVAVVR